MSEASASDTEFPVEVGRGRQRRRSAVADRDHDLIASDRVEGTDVYRPGGEKIGQVDHFMVDKQSGQVEYAVLRFSGFLGLGEELRPLPWDALEYSRDLQGYVVSADDDRFRDSPFIQGGTAPDWDSAYGRMLYEYWGLSW